MKWLQTDHVIAITQNVILGCIIASVRLLGICILLLQFSSPCPNKDAFSQI